MSRSLLLAAPDAAAFALRFRLLMSYHDLTLKDVAAATHSAVSTAGTWRNGRVPSSAVTLKKLAEIFHVSVDFLLAGQPAEPDRNGGADLGAVAGRILHDLELLKQALDGVAPPRECLAPLGAGKVLPAGRQPKNTALTRRRIERYLGDFLDRAEREPGGLAHAWVQLRREFPLDLYERLG